MFCTQCGTQNPDKNRFCRNCGKPLKAALPESPVAPPVSGTVAGTAGTTPPPAKNFNEFKSSLMTVDEFKKMSKDIPLKKRPQKWWDLLSIFGGIAAAVIWFFYGGLREGFDWLSSLLMIALPVVLVWFRPTIDRALLPIRPARKKVPRVLLIGLGIAIPFLTAWVLYNILHITQYSLMHANLVVGTLASYAIIRNPAVPATRQPEPGRGVQAIVMIICTILFMTVLVVPVYADDCIRDPLNARDCLRTGGYAETMAGLIAAILSGLVNGPAILQGLLQGKSGEEGEQEEGEEEGDISIRLTFPAGYSPRVFTEGWFFGASARIGDKDVSDSVRWSGTGTFSPDTGPISYPTFERPGPNRIVLSVKTEKGEVSKTFTVSAVSPGSYARMGSIASCLTDAHGCPACPHPVSGPVNSGSPTIRISGSPAARVGDTGIHAGCCGPNTFTIVSGDPSVLIDGLPAAIKGSQTKHCGGMGSITGV